MAQFITSNTTLSTANTDIIIDASSNKVKATLPLASTTTGIPFFIKCISVTNEARLTATGSSVGDGDFLFSFAGQQITVVSDGSNYEIQSRDTDTLTAKVYRALLSQVDVNAPTAVINENSLGETPTFAWVANGEFDLDTVGNIFVSGKTEVYVNHFPLNNQPGDIFSFYKSTTNKIKLYTNHNGSASNDILNSTEITILIYP